MNVFFTVDVEVWCDGWNDLDSRFPEAFQRYIYGPTSKGRYGLPHIVDVLNQHGLNGVFFVEPLFASRFGIQPLQEIVGLLNDAGQEIQLHMHTEWVDESRQPLLQDTSKKRQHMRYFTRDEQTTLVGHGLRLLDEAGAAETNAFRAGSFAFNADTLVALANNNVSFDSSYNASMFGPDSGVLPGTTLLNPTECDGVFEYPMTVFDDGTGSLRHAQVGACSYGEMVGLLRQALDAGLDSFVILFHNFELLNQAKQRKDDVVVRRFHKLCAFLDRHRDVFDTRGFKGLTPVTGAAQGKPLSSPIWKTGIRMAEQIYRRRFS